MSYWRKDKKKSQTRRYARGEHVMSGPEARVMRRIQSENGLTEEEVRSEKKFRKMLADAAQNLAISEPRETIVATAVVSPREQFISQVSCWSFCDEEMAERLYKRYAGLTLLEPSRPKKFHYATPEKVHHGIVMEAIDRCTDGQFVYNMKTGEVGFMYESNLTMFLLSYQYERDLHQE